MFVSLCPPVLPHGRTLLPLDGFSWNSTFWVFFSKIFFEKIQVATVSNKINNWYFTWRSMYIFVNTSYIRHASRNVCANGNLRGVLACEPTRAPRQITWRKQSDRSVSVRQNLMLNIPTALVTSLELTWREDSVSPALLINFQFSNHFPLFGSSRSPKLRVRFCYVLIFEGKDFSPMLTPLAWGPPILGCPQLLIQNISSYPLYSGRDSSVGIATRYGLGGPGIESRWDDIFRNRPHRSWGQPSLLYNEYRVLPLGKAVGAWRWLPTPI
jgi:hypothetical protein